jgi:hypothetical protein
MRRWEDVFCLVDVGGGVLKERYMSKAKIWEGGRQTISGKSAYLLPLMVVRRRN